jgi:hypothetical protein
MAPSFGPGDRLKQGAVEYDELDAFRRDDVIVEKEDGERGAASREKSDTAFCDITAVTREANRLICRSRKIKIYLYRVLK